MLTQYFERHLSMFFPLPIRPMEWTETHDVLLCRETLVEEPYKFKKGSADRGKSWTKIAEILNKNNEVKFKVAQRGVRERVERLEKRYKDQMKEEEAASGIEVDEPTELEVLISEIIDREKIEEETRESTQSTSTQKIEADKKTAEEMRMKAMERFGETQKRSLEAKDELKKGKRRRSSGDAIEFLKEKTEMEKELKMEEIAIKRKEQELDAARQAQNSIQQNKMAEMQVQMLQQQQQQTAAMMALIERLLPKK